MFARYLTRILCAAAILVFGSPAQAAPESYFASFGGGIDNIGKYPATPYAIGSPFAYGNDPHSLQVRGETLYWVQGNDIYQQNVNSGPATLLQQFGVPIVDFTVDAANGSYFASFGGGINNIGKYPLAPYTIGTPFAYTGSGARGLSLAGANLYWIDGNDIWVQNVNSGPATLLQQFGVSPIDLVVDAVNGFYYASFGDGIDNIGKYPLTPYSIGTALAFGNDPHGLNIVDGKLYWIADNDIWMSNLDGSSQAYLQQFGVSPLDLAFYSPEPVVNPNPPPVPEPASILLFGLGVAALGITRRKKEPQ